MLDNLKTCFHAIGDLWRNGMSTRWRVGVVIGLVVGVVLSAAKTMSDFAEMGCAIHGWTTIMVMGFLGVFMGIMLSMYIGVAMMLVLYIPEGLRNASESIRQELEFRRTLREEGGPRDWSRLKWHLCFWPMILILVAGLSLIFGYMAWALGC